MSGAVDILCFECKTDKMDINSRILWRLEPEVQFLCYKCWISKHTEKEDYDNNN